MLCRSRFNAANGRLAFGRPRDVRRLLNARVPLFRSTVPEVVAAHHCGIKVICLSLITNKVVTDDDPDAVAASHQEVLEAVQTRSAQIQELVKSVVSESKSYVSGLEELPAIDLSEARAKSKGGAVNLFSNPLFWLTVTTMGAMAIVKAKK